MSTEYRIEPSRRQFTVTDPWGEQVGVYETEEAALSAVELNKAEDVRWETAKLLFDISVKTLMQVRGLDRGTALRLMRDAAVGLSTRLD